MINPSKVGIYSLAKDFVHIIEYIISKLCAMLHSCYNIAKLLFK
jgi:hypothetical protein